MSAGEPWAEGMMAVEEGRSRESNPYLFDDEAHEADDWFDGFDEGVKERDGRLARDRQAAIGNDKTLKRIAAMSPESIAEAIGIPLDKWPGRCYEVACTMNSRLELGLTPCYGHFLGWVAPESMFNSKRWSLGFVNHGWLVTKSGVVVDPTRFVFEATQPAIHIGQDLGKEYERGGNTGVHRLLGGRPRPDFDAKAAKKDPQMLPAGEGADEMASAWVLAQLEQTPKRPQGVVTVAEMFWLCNGDPNAMVGESAPMAARFYKLAIAMGFQAAIPLENRLMVLDDEPQASEDAAHSLERSSA